MNLEQSDLLIRVDQNVINLVETVKAHIEKDELFQKFIYSEVEPLKAANSERRGAQKFAGAFYGVIGGLITLLGTIFFPHGH